MGRRNGAGRAAVSRRYRRAPAGVPPGPDPGHGCADPARCTNPSCARPVTIHLVRPEQARVVVRELPGWPVPAADSASALLDWVRERITRVRLLTIVDQDPFGAHAHFPILVKIWMSGRVPPVMPFEPGEALRLYRWSTGTGLDHVSRVFCCTLLCISAADDDLAGIAGSLVDSCLALGGAAPGLAGQLLAWRAVSEPPGTAKVGEDRAGPDPVALLALVLLRSAADPDDARLATLDRLVADAFTDPDTRPWRDSVSPDLTGPHAQTWQRLIGTVLGPRRTASPDVDRLVAALLR